MILIASGTGVVARPIIGELAKTAEPKRLLIEERPHWNLPAQFDVRQAVLNNAQVVADALDGVSQLVLVPKIDPDLVGKQRTLIDEARKAKVEQVTMISMIGANTGSCFRILRWFGVIESMLRESGLNFTLLRAAPFMQSLLLFRNPGQRSIFAPFRDVVFPWLDARDLAAATAALVAGSAEANRVYHLTGGEYFGFSQIADAISRQLDGEFDYVDITTHEACGHLECKGVSAPKIHAITEWWDALVSGMVEMPLSADAQTLLGRPPISLRQFVADHAEQFCDNKKAAAILSELEPSVA